MNEYPAGTGTRPEQDGELRQAARQAAEQTRSAVGEVAGTAKEQTRAVAGEVGHQARRAVGELRARADEQAWRQSRRAAQGIRQWADELAVAGDAVKPDSPVSDVVRQVADGGRRAADYLERNGLAGVVREVQDFARRRPGAFLAGALAAGFLAGRIAKAASESGTAGASGDGADTWRAAGPGAGRPWSDGGGRIAEGTWGAEDTTAPTAPIRQAPPVTPPAVAPGSAAPAAPPSPPPSGLSSQSHVTPAGPSGHGTGSGPGFGEERFPGTPVTPPPTDRGGEPR
ncbi:hypothetical protein ACFOWE_21660 [Planomonospora corallina]|uniref:Uncharacterized protein n=1 Tax=Planomonospora corallina TaxID=1806052 RepID=A0ABV8I9N8_9ACTN